VLVDEAMLVVGRSSAHWLEFLRTHEGPTLKPSEAAYSIGPDSVLYRRRFGSCAPGSASYRLLVSGAEQAATPRFTTNQCDGRECTATHPNQTRKEETTMIELFGTETEQQDLERKAADRADVPQTAALLPTVVYVTIRISC
jgi:hypothetical protein